LFYSNEDVNLRVKVHWNPRFRVSALETEITINFSEPEQAGMRPRTGVHNKKTKKVVCQIPKKYCIPGTTSKYFFLLLLRDYNYRF